MFGDFILWVKHTWKEFWCIHNYEWTGTIDFRYLCCTKCGRITKRPNLEKGNMFERNNEFKNRYQNTLKQINELSANLRNDDDKIRLLGLSDYDKRRNNSNL